MAFVIIVGCLVAFQERLPLPLAKLESNRKAMLTAQVDWSLEDHSARDGPSTTVHTSRFAGEDAMQVDWSDEAGSGQGRRQALQKRLDIGDDQWMIRGESSLSATLFPGRRSLMPMRTLGAAAGLTGSIDVERIVRGDAKKPVHYTVETVGDLHTVIARREEHTVRWIIDGARGWCPTRVTVEINGQFLREARTVPAEFDGVWFPGEVTFYERSFKGGAEPIRTLRVHGAAFNRPDQPTRLSPEDIGVDVGTAVRVVKHDKENGRFVLKNMAWNGRGLIPVAKMGSDVAAGRIKVGPRFEFQRKAINALFNSRFEDVDRAWRRIVVFCIRRYQLDKAQTERANAILADCLDRARLHLSRHAEEIDGFTAKIKALKANPVPKNEDRLRDLKQRIEKLTVPVTGIRDQSLLPRLRKLPTRAQRERAEKLDRERAAKRRPRADAPASQTTKP